MFEAVDGHDEGSQAVGPRQQVLGQRLDRREKRVVYPLGIGADITPRATLSVLPCLLVEGVGLGWSGVSLPTSERRQTS